MQAVPKGGRLKGTAAALATTIRTGALRRVTPLRTPPLALTATGEGLGLAAADVDPHGDLRARTLGLVVARVPVPAGLRRMAPLVLPAVCPPALASAARAFVLLQ